MKEKCWTKQLSVGPLVGVQRLLGFWKKGALLVHSNNEQLLLYDPNTQEMRDRSARLIIQIFTFKKVVYLLKSTIDKTN